MASSGILDPQTHIQLCHAKISQLQGRLFATLDILDHFRATYNNNLRSGKLLQKHLQEKLNIYQNIVRGLETERDDLRDAVGQLIHRVEQSTVVNYGSWPCSRMEISSFAEACNAWGSQVGVVKELKQELSAARGIITSLCRERDSERNAHARATQYSKYRIRILEAKLARREAELARNIEFSCRWFKSPLGVPSMGCDTTVNENSSPNEIISLLNRNASSHTQLEVEIKVLSQQLEDARAAQSGSNACDASLRNTMEGTEHFTEGSSGLCHIQKSLLPRVVSSDALASDVSLSPMSTPRASTSLLKDIGPIDQGDDLHPIKHLSRQIEDLASHVDLFTKERVKNFRILEQRGFETRNLARFYVQQLTNGKVPVASVRDTHSATFLPASEHSTQGESIAGNSGIIRDQHFTDGMSRTHQFSADGCGQETAGHSTTFLDDSDGEASMELSTPLIPMNLLPWSGPDARVLGIPQRINPHGLLSEYQCLDGHQAGSAVPVQPSPAELHLQNVERGITMAQHRLGCGELTLAVVQQSLNHLSHSSV